MRPINKKTSGGKTTPPCLPLPRGGQRWGYALCSLLILLFAGVAFAIPPITLLDAATATGAGAAKVPLESYKDWACQVNTTGSPTAVTVALEGNITGMIYNKMATQPLSAAELAATQANFVVVEMPANQIRGNLITLTGGTSPTVSMYCIGVR